MKISDKAYDILSWVGRIVLPALAALVVSLGDSLGFDGSIASTVIMAIDVFLNALLGETTAQYYKAKAEENEASEESVGL